MNGGDIREAGYRDVQLYRQGERLTCHLTWSRYRDRTYRIDLHGPEGWVTSTADDLFAALQQIRGVLEGGGWYVAVQGARRDASPSGMLRDTVGARNVYILHLGKDMDRNDLVDIFAEADERLPGTVDQQNKFYQRWRASVTR
jgi:hypothetical protein